MELKGDTREGSVLGIGASSASICVKNIWRTSDILLRTQKVHNLRLKTKVKYTHTNKKINKSKPKQKDELNCLA